MTGFVHLHTHSEFSKLDGLNKLDGLLNTLTGMGHTAGAISDHGNLAGSLDFQLKAGSRDRNTNELKYPGFKAIQACEFYVAFGSRHERNSITVPADDASDVDADSETAVDGRNKIKKNMHLTVIAATREGWANLVYLNNEAQKSFWAGPRIDFELLKENSAGLIVLTGCLGGPVAGPLSRGDVDLARTNMEILVDAVGKENLYVEVMLHGIEAEERALEGLYAIADEFDVQTVATNDSHYTHEGDCGHHEGFLSIGAQIKDPVSGRKRNVNLGDEKRFKFKGNGYHLRTEEEMRELSDDPRWQDACDETVRIADRVDENVIPTGMDLLPVFEPPNGFRSAKHYLVHLAKLGIEEKYGELTPELRERLNFELNIIEQSGFLAYFLIVWDVMVFAREQGIAVGYGRGSAAGSLISYALDIVDVDPMANGLLFERFLEPGRVGMPDIDLDFEAGRRHEIVAYLARRWGKSNVVRIGTRQMYLSKRAIKAAANITASSVRDKKFPNMGDRLSELVPLHQAKPMKLEKLMGNPDTTSNRDFHILLETYGDYGVELIEYAKAFENTVAGYSTHACGVLISKLPLDRLVPLLREPGFKEGPGKVAQMVTAWDGGNCEEFGMLKLDVLGIQNLDMISESFRIVKEIHGVDLTMKTIPHPDTKGDASVDKTWDMIGKGLLSMVFQMESSGMKRLAMDMGPDSLSVLSAIIAMYRPGPLSSGMVDSYVNRRHGREEINYDIFTSNPAEQAEIASILDDTQGVFIYQETLMKLAGRIAGFDAKERSKLRKAVGKKLKVEMDAVGVRFNSGAETEYLDEAGNIISPVFASSTADKMWERMKGSAEYLFNASHSYAYAMLAWVTAWMKANYSTEYGAAVLAVVDKEEKRIPALTSLRAEGLQVLPPSVNHSTERTAVVEGDIHLGLGEIKDVGNASKAIITERESNGRFTSLNDFATRMGGDANSTVIMALIEAGALDEFGPRLPLMMQARAAAEVSDASFDLDWSVTERAARQRTKLGVSLGESPLKTLAPMIREWASPCVEDRWGNPIGGVKARGLDNLPKGDASVVTVGIVSAVTERPQRNGGHYLMMTLESGKGTSMETMAWSSATEAAHVLDEDGEDNVPELGDVLFVSGKIQTRVREVRMIDEFTGEEGYETRETRQIIANSLWRLKPSQLDQPRVNPADSVMAFGFTSALVSMHDRRGSTPKPPTGPGTPVGAAADEVGTTEPVAPASSVSHAAESVLVSSGASTVVPFASEASRAAVTAVSGQTPSQDKVCVLMAGGGDLSLDRMVQIGGDKQAFAHSRRTRTAKLISPPAEAARLWENLYRYDHEDGTSFILVAKRLPQMASKDQAMRESLAEAVLELPTSMWTRIPSSDWLVIDTTTAFMRRALPQWEPVTEDARPTLMDVSHMMAR